MTFAPEPTVPADAPSALYWWLVTAAVCLTLVGTLVANELPPFLDRRARAKRFSARATRAQQRTTDFHRNAVGTVDREAHEPNAVLKEKCEPLRRQNSSELARPAKRRASAFFDTDDV